MFNKAKENLVLKKIIKTLEDNSGQFIKISIITAYVLITPHIGSANAAMAMPGQSALTTLAQWATGPLPTSIGILSIAGSCGALMFGDLGPWGKKLTGLVLGVAGALQAPNLVELMGSSVSGLFF